MIVHKQNYIDLLIPTSATLLLAFFYPVAGFIGAHVVGLSYLFLRDYKRYFHKDDNQLLSPIDGKVVSITPNVICPYLPGPWTQIAIQTTLLDSHTQYAPVEGNLVKHEVISEYKKVKLSDILGGKWLGEKLDFLIPLDFLNKQILVSEIQNEKTGSICLVETIADLGMFNLLPGLDKVMHNSFVDQGSIVGVGHLGYASYLTNLYVDEGVNIEVLVGQVVVGSETLVATNKNTNGTGRSIGSE
jgi:hypothetical protein